MSIIDLDAFRRARVMSDCSQRADSASIEGSHQSSDTTVRPGMAVLFELLARYQTVTLLSGISYQVRAGDLWEKAGQNWRCSETRINTLLTEVSGYSRSDWREVHLRSTKS